LTGSDTNQGRAQVSLLLLLRGRLRARADDEGVDTRGAIWEGFAAHVEDHVEMVELRQSSVRGFEHFHDLFRTGVKVINVLPQRGRELSCGALALRGAGAAENRGVALRIRLRVEATCLVVPWRDARQCHIVQITSMPLCDPRGDDSELGVVAWRLSCESAPRDRQRCPWDRRRQRTGHAEYAQQELVQWSPRR
jgi:hypothetical protein